MNYRLKTGQDTNKGVSQYEKTNIMTTVLALSEFALKKSCLYTIHSGRKIVTAEDIKRALKLECIIFFDRSDAPSKWQEVNKELLNNSDIISEMENTKYTTDVYTPFSQSTCSCNLCQSINNIDSIWSNFVPKNQMQVHMKKYLDQ